MARIGCFLACTFRLACAWALLGETQAASRAFERAAEALDCNSGTLTEMIDPETRAFLGNAPQALSHLALIHAAATLSGVEI